MKREKKPIGEVVNDMAAFLPAAFWLIVGALLVVVMCVWRVFWVCSIAMWLAMVSISLGFAYLRTAWNALDDEEMEELIDEEDDAN